MTQRRKCDYAGCDNPVYPNSDSKFCKEHYFDPAEDEENPIRWEIGTCSKWPLPSSPCVRAGGTLVAILPDCPSTTVKAREANARLIAAAPELLEAAKEAYKAIAIHKLSTASETIAIGLMLERAIAKAEQA